MKHSLWKKSLFAAAFSTNCVAVAFAQLPAEKMSPLNQLGRAWGWGVSDGYHECPEQPSYSKRTANRSQPKKSVGFLERFNPLDSKLYGQPCTSTAIGSSGSNYQPSINASPTAGYQQFAAPAESPLPNSSTNTWQAMPSSIQPTPATNQLSPVPRPSPQPAMQTPVPAQPPAMSNGSKNSLLNKSTDFSRSGNSTPDMPIEDPGPTGGNDLLVPPRDEVPPAPQIRSREPDDRPLGEIPDNWKAPDDQSPQFPVPGQNESDDEDLNLLPDGSAPPVTLRTYPQVGVDFFPQSSSVKASTISHNAFPQQSDRYMMPPKSHPSRRFLEGNPRPSIPENSSHAWGSAPRTYQTQVPFNRYR